MRLRDIGWLAFAVVWTLVAVLALLGMLVATGRQEWLVAFTAPLVVLGCYWLAAGSWLRTERGKHDLGEPPPGPRRLSDAWTKGYIAVAATCVLASGVALGAQWVMTR